MGRKGLNERLKRPLLSPNYGGLTRPAVSLVLKTSGARDGMGIDTSALRHICRERSHSFFNVGSVDVLTLTVLAAVQRMYLIFG